MWEGFHSSFKPAQAYGHQWRNIKLDPTCINCGSSVIKTAELKSHEMLHTGKSLSNAIFFENISIQPASNIIIFLMRFYVLSWGNDLSALGKKCNQCDYSFSEVGNLRMHLMKNTVEKSQTMCFSQSDNLRTHLITYRGGAHTNVTSVTRHSLMQAIWVTYLKHSSPNQFSIICPKIWMSINISAGWGYLHLFSSTMQF